MSSIKKPNNECPECCGEGFDLDIFYDTGGEEEDCYLCGGTGVYIDLSYDYEDARGNITKIDIPVGVNFFWPDATI